MNELELSKIENEKLKSLIYKIWIMTSNASNGELLREGYREIFEEIDYVLGKQKQV